MNLLLQVLGTLLGVVLLYSLFLVLMEDRLIYYPDSIGDWEAPARSGGAVEDVWITTEDGVRIHAWLLHAAEPAETTVLFFHGNAGNITGRLDWAQALTTLPADVLLVDYRGYGRSEGAPSEPGLYADAQAAYRYLTEERGVPAGSIVLYGKSLGGGPATELATRVPCRALILQSTFTSVPDMAQHTYPFLPARYLARTRFDSLAKIDRVDAPVLVVHSRDDDLIPAWMGERLHAAAEEPKRLALFDGPGHNDLVHHEKPALLRTFQDFLSEAAPQEEARARTQSTN